MSLADTARDTDRRKVVRCPVCQLPDPLPAEIAECRAQGIGGVRIARALKQDHNIVLAVSSISNHLTRCL